MVEESERDPFTAQPSSFAASDDYLATAYEGPARAEVYPLTSISLGLGFMSFGLGLLVGTNTLFDLFGDALEVLTPVLVTMITLIGLGAIVVGHVGYVRADRLELSGKGRAVAGFLLGYASVILGFVTLVLGSGAPPTPGIV